MNIQKLIALLALSAAPLSGAINLSNRTRYNLRQFDTGIGRGASLWHQHTTTDIGNPHGASLQLLPFVSFSVNNGAIGRQFGMKNTNTVPVATNRSLKLDSETVFPFHAIKHDNTEVTAGTNEESATLTLKPSFTLIGGTISLFQDGSEMAPGLSFQATVPIVYADVTFSPEGATPAMQSYFDGTYSNAGTQEALAYGKIINKHATLIGPIRLIATYNFLETETSFAGVTIGCSIATSKNSDQVSLMSPESLTSGSNKVILGLDAGKTVFTNPDYTGELHVSARYFHMIPKKEKRIIGVRENDGSAPLLSPYLLGGKSGTKGVFPLANILHRDVQLGRSHQVEASVLLALSYRSSWLFNLGYGLFAREGERIKLSTPWQEDIYAIASATYNTDETFSAVKKGESSEKTASSNRRYITADMLDLTTAENPAQLGVHGFVGAGYNGHVEKVPFVFGVGAQYEYNVTNATPASITLWSKLSLSF